MLLWNIPQIGKTTIKAGKPMKITNQEIKEARSNRKTQKMIFTKSLKAKKPDQIEKAKNSYIQSQQKLCELVEKNIAEDTKQSIRNLTKNGNMCYVLLIQRSVRQKESTQDRNSRKRLIICIRILVLF